MDLSFRILFILLIVLSSLSSSVLLFAIGEKRHSSVPGYPKIHAKSQLHTLMDGQGLWLHCNATGNPTPIVKWVFNGVVFNNATNYFPNGSMHIAHVDLSVAGAWKCRAKNEKGTTESSIMAVIVRVPALVKSLQAEPSTNVSKGQIVKIKCFGYGSLPLTLTWYKNGKRLTKMYDGRIIREDLEVISIRLNQTAEIQCSLKNMYGASNRTIRLFVHNVGALPTSVTPLVTSTSRPPIKCQVYTGTICNQWLLPGHRWAYDPQQVSLSSFKKRDKLVADVLHALDTADFRVGELETKQCRRGMKAMVCGRAFPVCVEGTGSGSGRSGRKVGPLCREHCEAVDRLFCRQITLSRIWEVLLKSGIHERELRLLLPDPLHSMCDDLPPAVKPEVERSGDTSSVRLRESSASHTTPTPPPPHCTMVDFEPEWRRPDDNTILAKNRCYVDRGRLYNGTVHHARTSKKSKLLSCAQWNDTEVAPDLNRKGYSIVAFPSLKTAGRSCRNPAGLEKRPFCVPENPTKREESAIIPCEILSCHEYYENQNGNSHVVSIFGFEISKQKMGIATVIIVVGFVLVILFICYCIYCLRRFGHKRFQMLNRSSDRSDGAQGRGSFLGIGSSIDASICSVDVSEAKSLLLTPNQDYHGRALADFISPQLQKLEYPRGEINDIKELGHGAFGEVYLVEAPKLGHIRKDQPPQVAMKVLKNDAAPDMQIQFLKEATLLAELDHKNIVKLLGISLVYKPFCMLMEYMEYGDLNSFLRRNDPNNKAQRSSFDRSTAEIFPRTGLMNGHLSNGGSPTEAVYIKPQIINLNRNTLCQMAVNIAEGMIYLSHSNYVHRDLASRNCLLDSKFNVKIADFGLCRHIRRGEDFIDDDNGAMPIRWMPLESILERRFNLDTDVWSFGVLLWELFSFALQPYYGKTHDEVIEFLQKGSYLDKPPFAPDNVYRLMLRCWSRQRSDRPTFAWLMRQLAELLRRWKDNERVT